MFNYPLTQVFSAEGEVTNVFDADTHAQLLADGWLEEQPALTVEEVVAAGYAPDAAEAIVTRENRKRGRA
jgi:hypothetical protein